MSQAASHVYHTCPTLAGASLLKAALQVFLYEEGEFLRCRPPRDKVMKAITILLQAMWQRLCVAWRAQAVAAPAFIQPHVAWSRVAGHVCHARPTIAGASLPKMAGGKVYIRLASVCVQVGAAFDERMRDKVMKAMTICLPRMWPWLCTAQRAQAMP